MQNSGKYKSKNGVDVITKLKSKATKHGHSEGHVCPAAGGKKIYY
tara:strand:+ start:769 stop:903 length:135 start_codon:yes stop_codon:yes gene_type:complete